MINVLLVDDHELVRTGVRRLLDDTRGIKVIAEACSGEEALGKVRERRPDVVLMDVNMPGMGGLEATRKLLKTDPGLKIIICTVHAEEPFPTRLMQAGAAGYLTKDCGIQEIIKAIRSVSKGERYVCSAIAQQLALSSMPGSAASPFHKLSQREMQVMLMLTQGQNAQEISDKLCLSPKTVATYRHRLLEKLGVYNDVELTRLAMRHGMIDTADTRDTTE
ncbi:MAG: UvrY/SirA/GacA family response regulator transcription factor [Gammaproteobacteria bacterium]|nr:UvrY/SirA/GacA family response regulator transcription factor [Gammaproteobacteria bacterium]NIR97082.1 UvrY/SirA/GacA family response regulator transcription factor [Gammaproteobacteria bacterium]NIT62784.1 UvrY/SirA/GacA family response regulator transcription factor [Gammaproteobacteria bacterium]NIV19747.1 UvrY/SirA/GacA family response regulator transcription factor [Gammaproteobacteria bacterium]NIX11171.1 UvrY/SirA/GacA family response regulator transcription factor [Gammaproteobacter